MRPVSRPRGSSALGTAVRPMRRFSPAARITADWSLRDTGLNCPTERVPDSRPLVQPGAGVSALHSCACDSSQTGRWRRTHANGEALHINQPRMVRLSVALKDGLSSRQHCQDLGRVW